MRGVSDSKWDDWFTVDLYEDIGNRGSAWLTWAEALWQAAQQVEAISRSVALPDGTEVMPTTASVYAMLLGYALECTLKGLWVEGGRIIVANGRYQGIDGVIDHQLLQLAKAVGIEASDDEFDVLNRLTPFIFYAGRYPVSRRFEDMKRRDVVGRGRTIPGFFAASDFAVATNVFLRLRAQLRYRTMQR